MKQKRQREEESAHTSSDIRSRAWTDSPILMYAWVVRLIGGFIYAFRAERTAKAKRETHFGFQQRQQVTGQKEPFRPLGSAYSDFGRLSPPRPQRGRALLLFHHLKNISISSLKFLI